MFKLRLWGYPDGTSLLEELHVTESAVISFVKLLQINEAVPVEEKVSIWVTPLELSTIKNIVDTCNITEQPVFSIFHQKSALNKCVGISHFPAYKIQEYSVAYATVTFDGTILMFENDFLVSKRCSKNPLFTTNYEYVDDGSATVEVNYIEGILNDIHYNQNESVHEATVPWLSARYNIHQIAKARVATQGEIGATASDKCVMFGVIVHDKKINFTIISGEPYDLKVSEILVPEWLGIELHGIDIDTVLPAGGELTFTIYAISNLGRNDVRDFFTIKFAEVVPRFNSYQRVSICVDIHRRQAPDILLVPDKGTYEESIEYKTMEFRSIANTYKTQPLMQNWKYSCKYSVTMYRTDYHKSFVNILKSGKRVVFQHPLWSQVTVLEDTMENSVFCKCDTAGCDFRVGEWAFVYIKTDEYYLRQIDQIVSEGLMFTRNVIADAGALVVPAFPAYVKDTIKTSYIGEQYIKGTIEVIEFREGEYYVPY